MKIRVNGVQDDYALYLGIQTNPGEVTKDAHKKAVAWAPKNAKSYSFTLTHTDYYGRSPVPEETGYADLVVCYFTTQKEGSFVL